jgi:hypothetical protein
MFLRAPLMEPYFKWTPDKVETLKELWAREDLTTNAIAYEMGASSKNVVISKAHSLALPHRKRGRKFLIHAGQPTDHDRSGQRRFVGFKPRRGGSPWGKMKDNHPAFTEARTLFPTRVFEGSALDRVLKSGENSRKTGRMVMKGRWAGMPIFTLTLEERKTCPRTCLEWKTCYGNNMQYAQRIMHNEAFALHLWSELMRLQAKHPAGFVVRLHVLGDFFSVQYVELWALALRKLPALRVFGYTARRLDDPIGAAVWKIVQKNWDRFAIRFSGGGPELPSTEVVDRADQARGIVCPAQSDENRSCATCGLCWHSKKTVSFVRH